ncbi:hypothetical protein LTR70_009901 [Exophiala xenobiotica]|uniref:Uncharacterized protein n=1 Tax=Lithohypha guttulata TaxID=1690604 RepID=A0ABR0JWG4_9EURO|nr:hypothetical protein LTR24_009745 [Lithohypha guttulata]KAK5309903.1 hypothetical protein LTR70_009901 [Exophiala xenobiotica]
MSYAIETKKRKFDRILESLTEPPSPQTRQQSESRASLDSRTNASTTKKTLREELIEASKKRRVSPTLSKSTSHKSLRGHYLPSSRAAFLERLETFRHITKWHVPSTIPINAAEWAKRGWVCADVDTVSCGSCSGRVTIDLDIHSRKEEAKENEDAAQENEVPNKAMYEDHEEGDDVAVEVYDALIKRIEGLLNMSGAISSVRSRFKSMVETIEEVPTVSDLPAYEDLSAPVARDLEALSFTPSNMDALKLAVCGWQYKEADVVECKHCFRSLGLWLYRGATPTVEHLDAVDSHLEYCPWRSPEAQDTELMMPDIDRSSGKKLKLPGWALVYHAIKKHNFKKGGADRSSLSITQVDGVDIERERLSPEQRDKKMRDLMRRIKEIKKPFNVKSLLRRKDRSDD